MRTLPLTVMFQERLFHLEGAADPLSTTWLALYFRGFGPGRECPRVGFVNSHDQADDGVFPPRSVRSTPGSPFADAKGDVVDRGQAPEDLGNLLQLQNVSVGRFPLVRHLGLLFRIRSRLFLRSVDAVNLEIYSTASQSASPSPKSPQPPFFKGGRGGISGNKCSLKENLFSEIRLLSELNRIFTPIAPGPSRQEEINPFGLNRTTSSG